MNQRINYEQPDGRDLSECEPIKWYCYNCEEVGFINDENVCTNCGLDHTTGEINEIEP